MRYIKGINDFLILNYSIKYLQMKAYKFNNVIIRLDNEPTNDDIEFELRIDNNIEIPSIILPVNQNSIIIPYSKFINTNSIIELKCINIDVGDSGIVGNSIYFGVY